MDRAVALAGALAARGGPRLPAVEWPVSIVSTNDRLKALARGGAPEWTAVLARLGVCYDALRSSPDAVLSAWRARAAAWWGSLVDVRTGDGSLRGRRHDVDEEGALVIELESGGRRRLLSGEVSRVRPAG